MHPFVKIAGFFLLLLMMPLLSATTILLLCGLISLLAAGLNFQHFSRLLKRMRWLFISLLLVYAYATPGEYLGFFPLDFAPSYEGLSMGLLQIAKLLIAVAGLSTLFASSSKTHLMAGLWTMLSPLRMLGIDVARFAARLLLTLHYVEQMAVGQKLKLDFSRLDRVAMDAIEADLSQPLLIEQPAFGWLDRMLLSLMLMAALAWLLAKFSLLDSVFKAWQA
ncbi:MAG: hypothetical protein LAC66_02300 [Methylotenera sp.]|nr:hypothetical protein [Methylotenera sp.]